VNGKWAEDKVNWAKVNSKWVEVNGNCDDVNGKCADTDLCQRTVSATQKTRRFPITKAVGSAACCGPQHRVCTPCGQNAEMLGTETADMACVIAN